MLPDGKLYVRGAEETIPAMARLVAAARAGRARPRRLGRRPRADRPRDLATTRTSARPTRRIACAARAAPGRSPRPSRRIRCRSRSAPARSATSRGASILLLKKTSTCSRTRTPTGCSRGSGPTRSCSSGSRPTSATTRRSAGCSSVAVRVRFVEDAARGLDDERAAACTAAWRESGVEFTTVDEVLAALLSSRSWRPCR